MKTSLCLFYSAFQKIFLFGSNIESSLITFTLEYWHTCTTLWAYSTLWLKTLGPLGSLDWIKSFSLSIIFSFCDWWTYWILISYQLPEAGLIPLLLRTYTYETFGLLVLSNCLMFRYFFELPVHYTISKLLFILVWKSCCFVLSFLLLFSNSFVLSVNCTMSIFLFINYKCSCHVTNILFRFPDSSV